MSNGRRFFNAFVVGCSNHHSLSHVRYSSPSTLGRGCQGLFEFVTPPKIPTQALLNLITTQLFFSFLFFSFLFFSFLSFPCFLSSVLFPSFILFFFTPKPKRRPRIDVFFFPSFLVGEILETKYSNEEGILNM